MGAASPSMPAIDVAFERIDKVARLATLLADQVLNAQLLRRPVPDDHIRSLCEAGLLLKEYGVELPSLLEQILLVAEAEASRSPPGSESGPATADNDTGQPSQPFRQASG